MGTMGSERKPEPHLWPFGKASRRRGPVPWAAVSE